MTCFHKKGKSTLLGGCKCKYEKNNLMKVNWIIALELGFLCVIISIINYLQYFDSFTICKGSHSIPFPSDHNSTLVNKSFKVIKWKRLYVQPTSENVTGIVFDWDCVKKMEDTWVYIVGDSSMRMFFRALIHAIEPTFDDPHFGSFVTHDKGGCTNEEDGHAGGGCLREYYNKHLQIRITYSFKTFADQPTLALDWLISKSSVPDILIGATGAWDMYHDKPDVLKALTWFTELHTMYPSAQILAITLVACPPFRIQATNYNHELHDRLWNQSFQNLAILDRQASTENISDPSLCGGFHVYQNLCLLHVHGFLDNIELTHT